MSANYKNNALNLIFWFFNIVIMMETILEKLFGHNMLVIVKLLRDRYYEGNGKKGDFSTFAKATYRVNEKVSLYGDLQLRLVNYKTSGLTSDRIPFNVDENYSFFNPKAGITYKLNSNNSMYFSYARANREPNRDDFENNVEVKPEQLNDFELGWRHKSKTI